MSSEDLPHSHRAQERRDELQGRAIRRDIAKSLAEALRRDERGISFEQPLSTVHRLDLAAAVTKALAREYPHGSWWRSVRLEDVGRVLGVFASRTSKAEAYGLLAAANLTGAFKSSFSELADAIPRLIGDPAHERRFEDVAGLSDDVTEGFVLHIGTLGSTDVELLFWSATISPIEALSDMGTELPTRPTGDPLYGFVA